MSGDLWIETIAGLICFADFTFVLLQVPFCYDAVFFGNDKMLLFQKD
jgi:hypothetical protein